MKHPANHRLLPLVLIGSLAFTMTSSAQYAEVFKVNFLNGASTVYNDVAVLDTTNAYTWHTMSGAWATPKSYDDTIGGYNVKLPNTQGAADNWGNTTTKLFETYARHVNTMTISLLDPAKTYDLCVYASYWWNANAQTFNVTDANGTGATLSTTGATHSGFTEGNNYVIFSGLVPTAGGEMTLNFLTSSSNEKFISGFELGQVGVLDHFKEGAGSMTVAEAALGAGLTSTFRAGLDNPTVATSFSVDATHLIKVIAPTGGFEVQQYPLITLPAGATVDVGSFQWMDVPRGVTGRLVIDTSGETPVLALNITEVGAPALLVWNGSLSPDWDIDQTANWIFSSTASKYLQGDGALFNDDAAGNFAVNLVAAVEPSAVEVANTNNAYSIRGSGSISGGGTLTKTGAGTLTLGTSNSYSGETWIDEGTVVLDADGALGPDGFATWVAPGATVNLNGTNAGAEAFVLEGDDEGLTGILTNGKEDSEGMAGGTITLPNTAVAMGGVGNIKLTGALVGSGAETSLEKTGAGTLELTANSTYTGGTTVSDGKLLLARSNGTFNSSQLRGILTVNSPGTLELRNGPFGWGGGLTEIRLNDTELTGTGGLGSWGINYTLKGSVINSTGRLDLGPFGPVTEPIITSLASATMSEIAVAGIEVRADAGTPQWDRAFFDVEDGGAVVDLRVHSGINRSVAAWVVGPGYLVKNGAGTLELMSGATNLNGTSQVNAGTLLLSNPSGSATGSGGIQVAAGATLGGTGIATGPVTAEGTLAPGSPAQPEGTLSLGSTTINGTLAVEVYQDFASRLTVTGDLAFGESAAVSFTAEEPTAPSYVIASYTGSFTGDLNPTNVPDGYEVVHLPASKLILLSDGSPLGYNGWITTFGLTGADQDMGADPDEDGLDNGIEYILGGNPAAGMDPDVVPPAMSLVDGNFVYSFDRVVSSLTPDVALFFEHSPDLAAWMAVGVEQASGFVTITRSDDGLTDRIVVTLPAATTQMFGRLRLSTPEE